MIVFSANTRKATATTDDAITTRSVGIPVSLVLSSEFDGLAKTLCAKNGTAAVDVVLVGDAVNAVLPPDVLLTTGQLQIGIYAADDEGNIVIPTVWALVGQVKQGAMPSGVDPLAPSPSWVAQVQNIASEAIQNSEQAIETANDAKEAAITAQDSAQASASAAAQSAADAGNSANAAAGSATDASESADAAAGSASTASTKAGEAAASATTASGAAATATTQAGNASDSAAAAAQSASEAEASAETASTKAGEASASATAAAGSAATAAQKASEAAQSATQAANSASSASTSATAAGMAQTGAETAQTAAETAAQSVGASAAQIAQNAEDIIDLKSAKLDKTVYANELTQATSEANAYVNYPYTFTAGHKYVFQVVSSTATMSAYVRNESTNVQFIGAVGPTNSVEFVASGNGNYVRVNSTKANEQFKITDLSTISEGLNGLASDKLDKSVYANELSETVVSVNSFENFPFTVTSGRKYKITVKTSGATMTFRTRAVPDTSYVDNVGPVAGGSSATFTASGNAIYISGISTKANAEFLIEEVGTVKYDLDVLMPKAPIVNLPPKLYAVTGLELNIYFDNIVENSENYQYNLTCTKGNQMERGFRFTPEDADAGTYDFQLDVLDLSGNVVTTATASLIVSASAAGSGDSVSILILGDSTVNGTDTQILNDFTGDDMTVTTVGTMGTSPAKHEGRVGWTFGYYYGSATVGGVTNPFYNPTPKTFDAGYYFTNSGVSAPDWFFIQLGINDLFTRTEESTVLSKINEMVTQCNAMIASILTASPTTQVGIAVTIPPNYSQDAFGKAYGCGQTRDRYRRSNMLWVSRVIEEFSGKEDNGIFLVPINTNLDTIYNMGLESDPVNARNTSITYQSPIANGGVHPVESGYQQLADVYTAFLKAQA